MARPIGSLSRLLPPAAVVVVVVVRHPPRPSLGTCGCKLIVCGRGRALGGVYVMVD